LKAIRELADQAAELSQRLSTLQGGAQSNEIEKELAAIANEIRSLTGYGEDINGLYAARDKAGQEANNADSAIIANQNGIASLGDQNVSLAVSGDSLVTAEANLQQALVDVESRMTLTSAGLTSTAVQYTSNNEVAVTSFETTA